MKTTIKTQNLLIRDYIMSAIDLTGYEEYKESSNPLKSVYEIYQSEYGYNRKRYPNEQQCFKEWLSGLPSCFNIDFENYRIIELGIEWGFLTENSPSLSVDNFINQWFMRISMNFFKNLK